MAMAYAPSFATVQALLDAGADDLALDGKGSCALLLLALGVEEGTGIAPLCSRRPDRALQEGIEVTVASEISQGDGLTHRTAYLGLGSDSVFIVKGSVSWFLQYVCGSVTNSDNYDT